MIDSTPMGPVVAALKARPKQAIADDRLASTAVLVPVFVQDDDLGVVFIRRTDRVETHKGEYCFPGGHAEPGDASLVATALRESEEELGVRPDDVCVLGELDDVQTINRVKIAPFVGQIPYPYGFSPDPYEVDAVVPLRLSDLLAPGVRSVEVWKRPHPDFPEGEARQITFYRIEGHVIWGATGRILDQFLCAIGRLS